MNLKHLLFLIIIISFSCKNNKKKQNKKTIAINQSKDSIISKEELIKNIYKDSSYTDINIKSTNKWLPNNKESVFVFQNKELEENLGNEVEVYVHIFDKTQENKTVFVDSYQPEGGNPFIETFFFENVDEDVDKELIILCSWEQRIKGIAEGKLYQVFVYDNYNKNTNTLNPMPNINSFFGVEFDGTQEGETIIAKFKNSDAIKKELKKIIKNK